MNTSAMDFRVQALLSIQRALWDMVTPSLRGIAIHLSYPEAHCRFIYDHVIGVEEAEIVSEVETYFNADFDQDVHTVFIADYVPSSSDRYLCTGEEWVYLRREPQQVSL